MPNVQCPVPDCGYSTGEMETAIVAALLVAHASVHTVHASFPSRRPPKVDRPRLTDNIDDVGWNAFRQDWETFVRANNVADADQSIQLFSCCDGDLKTKVTSICPDVYAKTLTDLMTLLKGLAVIPVAVSVKTNELLQMQQDAGEAIRAFHARVKGKAATCRFQVKCSHQHQPEGEVNVNYTDEMIRHVILNGLYDDDIRRDMFSMTEVDDMPNNELISKIEAKETAREATSKQSNNAITTQYKKQQKEKLLQKQEGKCSGCKTTIQLYKLMRNGKMNKKPFSECLNCWRKKNAVSSFCRE